MPLGQSSRVAKFIGLATDEMTFLDTVKPNQDDHALDTLRYLVKRLSAWKGAQSYGREVSYAIG